MKQSKRILTLVLSVLLTLALLPLTAGAAVKITPPKQTQYVDIGGTAQLALTVSGGKKASSLPITYVSDNPAVATVDETGLLIGVAKGIANITVTYDTQTLKVPVYVCEAFVTYTDKKTYKMSVPESWLDIGDEIGPPALCAFSTISQDPIVAATVLAQKLDVNLTTAQFVAVMIERYQTDFKNFQLISSNKTRFAGRDGWTIVCTFTDDQNINTKQQMTFLIKNKVLYEYAFSAYASAYDQYAIENKRMLESLKLLK